MNEFHEEPADELLAWRQLSRRDPASDTDADGSRVEFVAECLRVLDQLWPDDDRAIVGDSINVAGDSTPGDCFPSGEPCVAANLSAAPTRLRFGRFLIDRQLGCGGHGFVIRAIDPVLQRPVALKIPNLDSLASPDLRRRFVEESRTLARLAHPNLLPVLEAGTVGLACYLVTPYCAGPTLGEWLRRQSHPVDCALAARLVRDLARTVAYVHSRGILHRDIKPSNVLLEPVEHAPDRVNPPMFDYVPKLADFGLAKLVSSPANRTTTGAIVGTPTYMSPEQAESRHADVGVATDVYALGVMLYELLTGRPPYRGENIVETLRLISGSRLIPPRSMRADLPRDLSAICVKCLEYEADCRYRSADDLADDLTAFLECRPIRARSCRPLARLSKWSRRRPLVASLATSMIVLALVGLMAIGWQWRRAETHRRQAEETFSIAHGAIKHLHDVLFEEEGYDTPEFYALQKTVLDAAVPYYDQLLEIKPIDPELRVDFADVFMRLGHMADAHKAETEALEWFHKSAGIWQRLVEEDPTNAEYCYFFGKLQGRIGGLLRRQNDPGAGERLYQAAAIQEQLIRASPSFRRARWELSGVLGSLASLHIAHSEVEAAARVADRAVEVLVQIPLEEREARPMIQRILADAHLTSAFTRRAARKFDEATRSCREAEHLTRRLVAQDQDMPSSANTLVQSLELLAELAASSGDAEKSFAHYQDAIEVQQTLAIGYPNIPKYRQKLVDLQAQFFAQYCRQTEFDEAIRFILLKSLLVGW